jgi:hypothetical protein
MNCPRCGYARSEFDTYCLRCRLMDAQGIRPAVNIADQTIVMNDMNDLPGTLPPTPLVRRRSRTLVPVVLIFLILLAGGVVWHLTVH